MAIITDQLLLDAQCILNCIPQGMVEASQLGQLVALNQATVVTTGQVTVGTNGVQLMADNAKRRYAVVMNTNPVNQAFIGPSTVTTSGATQGSLLGASGTGELARQFIYSTSALFAASVGVSIHVIEFSTP